MIESKCKKLKACTVTSTPRVHMQVDVGVACHAYVNPVYRACHQQVRTHGMPTSTRISNLSVESVNMFTGSSLVKLSYGSFTKELPLHISLMSMLALISALIQ
jgi:hypothetical protein